jgi:hypothetical protein
MKKILIVLTLLIIAKINIAQVTIISSKMDVSDLRKAVDNIGQMHNDYLQFVEDQFKLKTLNPSSVNFLAELEKASQDYFAKSGINSSVKASNEFYKSNASLTTVEAVKGSKISDQALSYLSDLQTLTNGNTDVYRLSKICKIKIDECFKNLKDDNEKLLVGGAFSVAYNSALYWNDHYTIWLGFSPKKSSFNAVQASYSSIKFNRFFNLPPVVSADAIGAVSGAIHGCVGGPAGAVAGAIVEAGFASCCHLIGSGFGWWD